MNNLPEDKKNIKIRVLIAVVVILGLCGVAYLQFTRPSLPQEALSVTSPIETATETPDVVVEPIPLPITAPKLNPPISAKPAPGVPVVSAQPAAINWVGIWQGPMKITAPLDCASKTQRDAEMTVYINSITDNKISGRVTAVGLDSDGTESAIGNGLIDGDKFSLIADGIAPGFHMSGNISGDTLSVKSLRANDCGTITTERPVQLSRIK